MQRVLGSSVFVRERQRAGVHPVLIACLTFAATADEVFDHALAAIKGQDIPFSAGPTGPQNDVNHNHGGRGVYFDDPSGHHFELITKPYGFAG